MIEVEAAVGGALRPVRIERSFESWQSAARELLRDGLPPDSIEWVEGSLPPRLDFSAGQAAPPPPAGAHRVPRRFLELARQVATHPSPDKWALLYRVLWRIVHEEHDLLKAERDADVSRLLQMEKESRAPSATQQAQLTAVGEASSAAPFVPAGGSLADLRAAAAGCTGCELYRNATQTVFGLGPETARVTLVGEAPGDQEDLQGAPFVGPAGQVLDRALVEVGLRRDEVYLTNVVKHFKFVQRGKRRLHETPREREILACQPWLEAELQTLRPEVLVCLGATASRAIFGASFRLMKERGELRPTRWARRTLATLHPSAVLRAEDPPAQERLYGLLTQDLRTVATVLAGAAPTPEA